ncbi:MAG: 30S ribosomal protein S16 [Armatimonadota bacterium]|nr:MAG: 30S ribosomal protein S16 [Armatimonadota bacterium]
MAVKLRLRRVGAKHQPRYRIVATDVRSPRDGRFIEVIGYYNPARQPHEVGIKEELALKWLKHGALPTETVRDLLIQQGILQKFYEEQGKPMPDFGKGEAQVAPRAEAAPAAAEEPGAEAAGQPPAAPPSAEAEAPEQPAAETPAPEAEAAQPQPDATEPQSEAASDAPAAPAPEEAPEETTTAN